MNKRQKLYVTELMSGNDERTVVCRTTMKWKLNKTEDISLLSHTRQTETAVRRTWVKDKDTKEDSWVQLFFISNGFVAAEQTVAMDVPVSNTGGCARKQFMTNPLLWSFMHNVAYVHRITVYKMIILMRKAVKNQIFCECFHIENICSRHKYWYFLFNSST